MHKIVITLRFVAILFTWQSIAINSCAKDSESPDIVRLSALLESTKSPNGRYALSVDCIDSLHSSDRSARDSRFSDAKLHIVRLYDEKPILTIPFLADEDSDARPAYSKVFAKWSADNRYIAIKCIERNYHSLQILRIIQNKKGEAVTNLKLPDETIISNEVRKRIKGFVEFRTRGGISITEWLPNSKMRLAFNFDYINRDEDHPSFSFILLDDGTNELKIERIEEHRE